MRILSKIFSYLGMKWASENINCVLLFIRRELITKTYTDRKKKCIFLLKTGNKNVFILIFFLFILCFYFELNFYFADFFVYICDSMRKADKCQNALVHWTTSPIKQRVPDWEFDLTFDTFGSTWFHYLLRASDPISDSYYVYCGIVTRICMSV